MSKYYQIQAQFGKTWIIVKTMQLHSDALDYIRSSSERKYPLRIVRVVKTVVFEETK